MLDFFVIFFVLSCTLFFVIYSYISAVFFPGLLVVQMHAFIFGTISHCINVF